MKESILIEMRNKVDALTRVIQQIIYDINETKDLSRGTLEVLKKIPGYKKAVDELKTEKETYQSYGSCLSYLRRYALMTMFGLRSTDDDGNSSLRGRKVSPLVSHNSATSGNTSNSSSVSVPPLSKLKDDLSKCTTAKEVNAYWVANYSAKNKTTTDAELELFTKRKQELN